MRALIAAGAVFLLAAGIARAELDEDDKAWLLDVRPLLLEEEEEVFRSLHSKEDRLELRRIFWARRDPDLVTPDNELEAVYRRRRAEADQRFSVGPAFPEIMRTFSTPPRPRSGPGRRAAEAAVADESVLREQRERREPMAGSLTDCGLFYIVLGPPDDVDARQRVAAGRLGAQSWSYKKKKTRLLFDDTCMLPAGHDKVRRQAREYAVAHPQIEIRAVGGELVRRLADMMPKVPPVRMLLQNPRQDFSCATEHYFLKVDDGTGVFGLLRGEGVQLFREEAEGGKVRLVVRAEATREDGAGDTVVSEREALSPVESDGTFVVSYEMGLRPGSHRLRLAVMDANSDKGVAVEHTLKVPDFSAGHLTLAPILALPRIEEAARRDRRHPLEAFHIEGQRYVPRFGNVFSTSESLSIVYQYYDARTDVATQKPRATGHVRILDARELPVAEGPEDTFDTPVGGTVVGPLALARYPPGAYTIELRVTDHVEGKTYIRRSRFELQADRPIAAAALP